MKTVTLDNHLLLVTLDASLSVLLHVSGWSYLSGVYTVCFVCHFRLGATATVLRKREVIQAGPEQRWVAEVLVRKVPDDQQVKF